MLILLLYCQLHLQNSVNSLSINPEIASLTTASGAKQSTEAAGRGGAGTLEHVYINYMGLFLHTKYSIQGNSDK